MLMRHGIAPRWRPFLPTALAALMTAALPLASPAMADGAPPDQLEFFEKHIRPILVDKCVKCHGGEKTKGGLKLTSRAAVLEGGKTGPAAVAGKPDESLLIRAVRHLDLNMPPSPAKKLKDTEIAALARWVEVG